MFIKDTLFVQFVPGRYKAKELAYTKQLVGENKTYQVYDIWYGTQGPMYGIVGDDGVMVYVHHSNFYVCDGKTRKPLIKGE